MTDDELSFSDVQRTMDASAHRVFHELSDGWAFVGWVVGATHIRDVDPGWPAVGTRIHHKIGSWPVVLADTTESLECEPDRRLLLKARGWPMGEAIVEILLAEVEDSRTQVTLREAPSAGPAKFLDNPVLRWMLKARNVETLSRLADRVENRPSAA